ncbi:hypothetical protein OG911_28065 [Streptomyces sp. NBC_00208]|uniref:hypothetical protein n=1 Tax=Streptomyces sp. NBC_00208 TaxID=2975681 RepID=UPI002E2A62A4|nr:hypothetical protein [Streptomyces sp. NBC_00208]
MYVYTPAEKRQRSKLFRQGFRQALADCVDPKVNARIDAIDRVAAERGQRELNALHAVREKDRQAVATAKATLRTAPWAERSAARRQVRDAEQQLRRSERAVDKAERE